MRCTVQVSVNLVVKVNVIFVRTDYYVRVILKTVLQNVVHAPNETVLKHAEDLMKCLLYFLTR